MLSPSWLRSRSRPASAAPRGDQAAPRRRPFLVPAFVNLGLGLLFLATGFNRPTIASMRTVDLLHLLVTGGMLSTGLAGVVMHFVHPREG